jgi:hypothetical protein
MARVYTYTGHVRVSVARLRTAILRGIVGKVLICPIVIRIGGLHVGAHFCPFNSVNWCERSKVRLRVPPPPGGLTPSPARRSIWPGAIAPEIGQ